MAKTKTKVELKVRIPHIVIDGRDADPKLLEALAPGLEELEARIRVLGDGVPGLAHAFSVEEALEEANIWVILSDTLPKEFKMLIKEGIVPVMLRGTHPEAENYMPAQEKGNAFLYPKLTEWFVYGSIIRALENFHFSYDWQNIQRQGKKLI